MPSDYIPDSFQNRLNWLNHLSSEIAKQGPKLPWTAQEITNFQASLVPLIIKYQAIVDAQTVVDAAIGAAKTEFDDKSAELRRSINEIKTATGYDDGIGAALDILTRNGKTDPGSIKPLLSVTATLGHLRLSGKKGGAETLNIYSRKKGETVWTLKIAKRKSLPVDDDTPPVGGATLEEREYRAIGVLGDDEVGQPSDIVGAVWGS